MKIALLNNNASVNDVPLYHYIITIHHLCEFNSSELLIKHISNNIGVDISHII